MSGRKPTVSGAFCQSCGKSDPLNEKYCVLCGAEIRKATPDPEAAAAGDDAANGDGAGASAAGLADVAVASGGKPPARRARGGSGGTGWILIAAAVILGLGMGAAAGWKMRQSSEPPPTVSGLSLAAGKPYADVLLNVSGKNSEFIMGAADASGTFHIPKGDSLTKGETRFTASVDGQALDKPINVVP